MSNLLVKNSRNDIVLKSNGSAPIYLNGSRNGNGDIIVRNTEEDIIVKLPVAGPPGPPGKDGIPEAPSDGKSYARANSAWTTALLGISRSSFALGAVTAIGATTIDHAAGEMQTVTLTGNASLTVVNWPAYGLAKLVLQIKNTGPYGVIAWPSGTLWPQGEAPLITPGAGKLDVIVLMTSDGGTTILGSIVGQDYQ
jgi:hypothetical protein